MTSVPSARRAELLEAAYEYVLANGLADVSLRPIAEAIGSSTGVLRFLFSSRDGLVAALLERARADELAMLEQLPAEGDLPGIAGAVWEWISAPVHGPLITLWIESYATSLQTHDGPWAGFAARTVDDWLAVFATAQPRNVRHTSEGRAQRTAVLAVLRGAMLDLSATGERARVTRAVRTALAALG